MFLLGAYFVAGAISYAIDGRDFDWPLGFAVPCVIVASTLYSAVWREALVVSGAWLLAFGFATREWSDSAPLMFAAGAAVLAIGLVGLRRSPR